MKKYLMLFVGIFAIMLLAWGCSSDSPTTSNDLSTAMKMDSPDKVNVLVGFTKGHRPDAAVKALGGSINQEFRHVPGVYVSIPSSARRALETNPNGA